MPSALHFHQLAFVAQASWLGDTTTLEAQNWFGLRKRVEPRIGSQLVPNEWGMDIFEPPTMA